MVVEASVGGIEVHRALPFQELPVGGNRGRIACHHIVMLATQHVDVGRHVDQMPRIGDEIDERITGQARSLRMRRHLHEAWMTIGALGIEFGARSKAPRS